jgi:hypothetical protein
MIDPLPWAVHHRHRRPGRNEMRPHVQLPGTVHVFGGDLFQPAGDLDPGMGMQDIQPPVAHGSTVNLGLHGSIVADVQTARLGLPAALHDLRGHRARPVAVAVGHQTSAPSAAMAMAPARPMPDPAPVTKATRPTSCCAPPAIIPPCVRAAGWLAP